MAKIPWDRIRSLPWRQFTSEAFDRIFFVAKACCFVHVTNRHILSAAVPWGPSMLPTFNLTGDRVLVDRLSLRWNPVGKGHVITLRSPLNPRVVFIKRVTAVEGESVTFVGDRESGSEVTVVVPKGHVWVEGDNPSNTNDSKTFGAVPYGLIEGRVFLRVWPPEDFGLVK